MAIKEVEDKSFDKKNELLVEYKSTVKEHTQDISRLKVKISRGQIRLKEAQ